MAHLISLAETAKYFTNTRVRKRKNQNPPGEDYAKSSGCKFYEKSGDFGKFGESRQSPCGFGDVPNSP